MTDNATPLTELRATPPPAYSDTDSLNDIQALLTSPHSPRGVDAVDSIGDIVARTGRSLIRARIITPSVGTDKRGLPFAFIDADGTYVRVSQNADSPGIRVEIWTVSDTGTSGLVLNVNGTLPDHRGGPATTWYHDASTPAEPGALDEQEADRGRR
jgi:hypothetical protein